MPLHIKNILPSFLKQSPLKEWQLLLFQNWQAIIGDLQTHVKLEKINPDNSLVIGVNNISWLHELHMLSPVLIQKINQSLDKPYVKEVRFKYSPEKSRAQAATIKKEASPLRFKPRNLTTSEALALDRIDDKDLQEALKNFLIRCQKER